MQQHGDPHARGRRAGRCALAVAARRRGAQRADRRRSRVRGDAADLLGRLPQALRLARPRARRASTVRVLRRGPLERAVRDLPRRRRPRRRRRRPRSRPGSARRLDVRVPLGAVTGPVSAAVSSRAALQAPRGPSSILPPPPPQANPTLTPVPGPRQAARPALETGTSRTKAFVGARRAVTFSYRVTEDAAPRISRSQLVRGTDGSVVRTWSAGHARPGHGASGRLERRLPARGPPRPGRYSFRLTASGASGAIARSASRAGRSRATLRPLRPRLPHPRAPRLRRRSADFGSGRSGHSHQGHDVFARCGTPHGGRPRRQGRVQGLPPRRRQLPGDRRRRHRRRLRVHAPRRSPRPSRRGDRVYTGQQIGAVGETGNARGCHLHYEMWGAPGWYDGGRPFDPLPSLRAWDRWS